MKNKILFAGDPHGEYKHSIAAVLKYRPEAIVFLGDFGLEAPLETYLEPIIGLTQILLIHGNHDVEKVEQYEFLSKSPLFENNIHLKVIEVGGLRIAGLGGIFMGRVWRPGCIPKWTDKKHWLQCKPSNVKKIPVHIDNAIWYDEFERMKETVRADILVTHEAPSCHQYGFSAIEELAAAIGATKIIHGHHHHWYVDSINGITVTGAPIGGVVNLDGEHLIEDEK